MSERTYIVIRESERRFVVARRRLGGETYNALCWASNEIAAVEIAAALNANKDKLDSEKARLNAMVVKP